MYKYTPNSMEVGDGFYLADYPDCLPVNKKGEILVNGVVTKGNLGKNSSYYGINKIHVHRIVALTFLECPGEPELYQVNHKDGNKLNNHIDNLEWCTPSYNIIHAYKNGLRYDNIPLLAKNLETDEIISFYSLQECARFLGANGSTIFNYLKPKKTPKGTWGKKWVIIREGEEWPNLTKEDIKSSLGCEFEILAISKEGDRKIIFPSIIAGAKYINSNNSTLNWYLKRKGVSKSNFYRGFYWYYLDEYTNELGEVERVCIDRTKVNNFTKRIPKKIKVTNIYTGDEVIWDSVEILANSLGMKKNSLEKAIWKKHGVFKEFTCEYIPHNHVPLMSNCKCESSLIAGNPLESLSTTCR